MNKTFGLIGGDRRQAELARLLERVYQRSKEESKAGFIHLSQYLAQKGGEQ